MLRLRLDPKGQPKSAASALSDSITRRLTESMSRLELIPAPECYDGPDCLDQSERPRALQKPIGRAQQAGAGERQHKPVAARFERVGYEHHGNGEEAIKR